MWYIDQLNPKSILGHSPDTSAPVNNEEKQKNYDLARKLLAEQNFAAAVIGGAIVALLGAAALGFTVSSWRSTYGFVAAGVGLIIGVSVGFFGRGITTKFGVLAALYTIASCVLGNVVGVIMMLSRANSTSPIDILLSNSLALLAERAISSVSFIYFVYWFVAIFGAVFLAKRPLSRSERLAVGLFELRD